MNTEKSFLSKNESTKLKVKSTDTKGEETSVEDVDLKLYKTEWVRSKRLGTDGRYHSQWKKERELVKSFEFNTDQNGNYSETVKFSEEGRYEAEVSATDPRGNMVMNTDNLYVYGEESASVKPTSGNDLELEVKEKI